MSAKRQSRFLILSLWVGILIPIVAALIPFGYRRLVPEHDLVYELTGPISVKGTEALSLTIRNQGERLEKNVRIWARADSTFLALDSLRRGKPRNPLDFVAVDSPATVRVAKEQDYYVLIVGDIRPGEHVEVSFLSEAISVYRVLTDVYGLSIKSDEHVARLLKPSELERFFYPIGFWMFVILMVLILGAGIYQASMDPKKREEMLLSEIDKLGKE